MTISRRFPSNARQAQPVTTLQAVTRVLGTAIICLASVFLHAQEMGFELRVDAPSTVTAGDQFDVTLRGSSSLDLLGYAAQLTYDPAVLSLVPAPNDVLLSGTVWESAEFLVAMDDPTTGVIVIGVIFDGDEEGVGRVVAAGDDLQFLNLSFQAAEVESPTRTTIDFSDDIDGNLLADVDLAGHDAASDLTLLPATIDVVLSENAFLRGDCNGDGSVAGAVTDAVFLLQFNFAGGAEPPCVAACDANGDGSTLGQVSDAIYILLFNFVGGAPPVAPFPDCGPGELPTDEKLGCESATEACA